MCMSLDFTYPSLEEPIKPKAENGMWGESEEEGCGGTRLHTPVFPGCELASVICHLWELEKMS